MTDDRRISKSLSYWLRHKPDAGGLELDPSGWALVDQALAALRRSGLPHGIEDLDRVVRDSDKQRFELNADRSLIRARQGHSVEVELGWPATEPPELLYHGTVERFLAAILAEGLRPMKRHHVHLSPDLATASAVGARRGEAVILRVAAARMAADGAIFYLTGNGVWLTDQVPARYLERM